MSDDMTDAAPEERDEEYNEENLKNDVHRAINDAQAARRDASRSFGASREKLVEQARAAGSQDPERDAGRIHGMVLRDIDRQMHKSVHAAFEKYGWSRETPSVEFTGAERRREGRDRPAETDRETRREPRQRHSRRRSRQLSMEQDRD